MGNRFRRIGRRLAPVGSWSILFGIALVALGAALAFGASGEPTCVPFWAGVILLFGGSTLVLSGVSALDRPRHAPASLPARWRHSQTGEVRDVLTLGELAVHHAGFINEEQLEAALAVHRTERRRLGGVMVSMGLITPKQLAELLTLQAQGSDAWGRGV